MARILITNFHPKTGGGHETYIHSLLKIDKESNVIGVAAPESSRLYQDLKAQNLDHIFACDFPAKLQKEPFNILKNVIKFSKIVSEFQPDIVHTNGVDLFIVNIVRFFRPFKIIRTHHAIKHISNDAYHRWLYCKRVSQNIYVSKTARELAFKKGLNIANSVIIENGIDLSAYKPVSKRKDILEKFNIDPNIFTFGSNAGTAHYKRVDLIIDAAVKLKKITDKPFQILVLGENDDGKKLQENANKKGLIEFRYIGYHKDTRPFISLFDTGFILSDKIETISYAAREMLSMGIPIISSSFSGLKDNIIDYYNGILVEPNNLDHILNAMIYFMNTDQKKRTIFSENSRNHAKEKFSLKTQINLHKSLYKKIFES